MTPASTHRGYRIFFGKGIRPDEALPLIDALLDHSWEPHRVFKDNHRTFSAVFDTDHRFVMVKIPRSRNQRLWERILTLFRSGEGPRALCSLERMQALGMGAPVPICAAEKRHLGYVVDSFTLYAFEEGQPAGEDDAPQVVAALRKLHRLGYLRTDPQAANFLITPRGVVFIDFRLKRPRVFARLRQNMELAKLARAYPASAGLIRDEESESSRYAFAAWLDGKLYDFRQLKRKARRGARRSQHRQ